jgi:two-component system NtrC family sensor kinase
MVERKSGSGKRTELRRQAEERFAATGKKMALPASDRDAQRLLHELQVHQIELEMQNEELARTREKAETALARYTDLYDFAPVGYFTLDESGTILRANLAAALMVGVERSRLIKRRFISFVSPGDYHVFAGLLSAVFGSGPREACELTVKQKGGGSIYVRLRAAASEDGRECRVAVTDITELKRAEDALRESEEKYRALVENMTEGIWVIDGRFRTTFVNRSMAEMLGYPVEELTGRHFFSLVNEPRGEVKKVARDYLMKGGRLPHEVEFVRKDGTPLYALMTTAVVIDTEGNCASVIAMVTDIGEKKRLERQLGQAEKLSTMGTMISGVAHEINNPLTAVIGNAQLLANSESSSYTKAKLAVILQESLRAARIVRGLLTFAREHSPERRMTDINDTVRLSLKLREYDLNVRNINVRLSLSDDLPTTMANPHELQQVFLNVINNASDALEEKRGGMLTIRTRPENGLVVVEFEDDGPGISKENLSRVFDPFFTTKEVGAGTGLGLSIAYGIVREHGGTIEAHSTEGAGATFVVRLPVIEGERPAAAGAVGTDEPRSVLVVEDEPSLRDLISEALTDAGYTVETAAGGAAAIGLIDRGTYDAVVSDVRMPGLSGKDIYEHTREANPSLAERIVFITGDVLSKDTHDFMKGIANRFVKKPFDLDVLVGAVHDLFKGE